MLQPITSRPVASDALHTVRRVRVCSQGVVGNTDRRKAGDMESAADLPMLLPAGDRVLPRMLRRQAALYGDRKLVEIGDHAWSFRHALDVASCFGGSCEPLG